MKKNNLIYYQYLKSYELVEYLFLYKKNNNSKKEKTNLKQLKTQLIKGLEKYIEKFPKKLDQYNKEKAVFVNNQKLIDCFGFNEEF